MKPLFLARENGNNTFARPTSDFVDARVLAAGVAEVHTVPAGADFVIFSADNNFYAKPGAVVPTVPSVDVTDGSAPELNPGVWSLEGVTQIRLIAPLATVVTMSFYKRSN